MAWGFERNWEPRQLMGTEDVLLSPESSGLPEPPAEPGTMQGTGPAPSLCLPSWWLDCGPMLPEGCLSLGCCQHSDHIKGKGALFTALAMPARLSPGTWLCPYMLRGFSGGPTGALAWPATRHWPQSVFLNPERQSPQDGMDSAGSQASSPSSPLVPKYCSQLG